MGILNNEDARARIYKTLSRYVTRYPVSFSLSLNRSFTQFNTNSMLCRRTDQIMNKYVMYKCMESSNTSRTSSCKTKKIISAKEVCTPALRFWTTCILLLRLLLNFVSIRKICQTRESVFNRQSRHLECRQKCCSRPISSRCLDIQMKHCLSWYSRCSSW